MTLAELRSRLDEGGLTLLDVRTPQEFEGSAGAHCGSDKSESVNVAAITAVLVKWTQELGTTPALCVMNIEGGEFQCLPALLDAGMDTFFGAIQVQPHGVIPNAAEVWAGIRSRLLINFRVTSEDPGLGTGWILLERK